MKMFNIEHFIGQDLAILPQNYTSVTDTYENDNDSVKEVIKKELEKISDSNNVEEEREYWRKSIGYIKDNTKDLKGFSFISLLELREILKKEPFYIRNHNITWMLNVHINGFLLEYYPLPQIAYNLSNCRYIEGRMPSPIIGWENASCKIMFTSGGKINFIGGFSEEELICYVTNFFYDIKKILRKLYYIDDNTNKMTISISLKQVNNRMATTTMPISNKLNIGSLMSYLSSSSFNFSYDHTRQGLKLLIYDKQDPPLNKITIQFFSKGGITVFGFKSMREINTTIHFIYSLLRPFITIQTEPGDLMEWRKRKDIKRQKELLSNKRKKIKKIEQQKQKILSSNENMSSSS